MTPSGLDICPSVLSVAARYAAEAGLEVWFALDSGWDPRRGRGVGRAADTDAEEPFIKEDLVRDEHEQSRYATELLDVFDELGVDSAFWFTFAGYRLPHRNDPRHDLDLASYGVVKMLDAPATGTPYPDMPWEPKTVFDALASRNAGSTAARTTAPLRPNATG